MNIVSRVQNMILRPASEWPVVAAEPLTPMQIFTSYVIPLVALASICSTIGIVLTGLISHTLSLVIAVFSLVFSFVSGCAAVWIIALIVDLLATAFNGQKNYDRAFKLSAFALTPLFIANTLSILPFVGGLLSLAGLYWIYVMYLGIAGMMFTPQQKAVPYTASVAGITIVLGLIVGGIAAAITFAVTMAGLATHAHRYGDAGNTGATVASVSSLFGANADQARAVQDSVNAVASAAPEDAPAPGASMDAATAVNVGANVLKAFAGGGHTVTVVPRQELAALIPAQLGDLTRTAQTSSNTQLQGFATSQAQGDFKAGDGTVRVEIADLGNASSLLTMMTSTMGMVSSDDDNGFEKTVDLGGQRVHETWKNDGKHSELLAVVDNRFTVTLTGEGVDIGTTEKTMTSLDLSHLADLGAAK